MIVIREIKFGKTIKPLIYIKNNKVFLGISYFRNSSVRIADNCGNHIYLPREENLKESYFLEWMITNSEISGLIKEFLSKEEIKELVKELNLINEYIEQQKEYIGRRIEEDKHNIKNFKSFNIIPRSERFFTFKKSIKNTNSFVEVTFKPGDVSPMEEHMYMLISFKRLSFICNKKSLSFKDKIGVPCFAIWSPDKEEIKEIVRTIGHTSEKHKKQLIEEISKS